MTLDKVAVGQRARIVTVRGAGALRRRLLDMGLTPHTEVLVRKVAPLGDPLELTLRGYELTLRIEDARNIDVEPCGDFGGAPEHRQGGNGHGIRTGR